MLISAVTHPTPPSTLRSCPTLLSILRIDFVMRHILAELIGIDGSLHAILALNGKQHDRYPSARNTHKLEPGNRLAQHKRHKRNDHKWIRRSKRSDDGSIASVLECSK